MEYSTAAKQDNVTTGPLRLGWLSRLPPDGFLVLWKIFDVALVGVTGLLSAWLNFNTPDLSAMRGLAVMFAMAIAWFAFSYVGLHRIALAPRPLAQLRLATKATIITMLVVMAIGFAARTGAEISRLWAVLWLVWAILAFTATRPLISDLYRRLERTKGFIRRHVIFSTTEYLDRVDVLFARWESFMRPSDTVEAIFLDNLDSEAGRQRPAWRNLIKGNFGDFVSWDGHDSINRAVVLAAPDNRKQLEPILEQLGAVAVDVDLIAGDIDEVWARRPVTKVAGLPSVRVMARPLTPTQRMIKRLEDLVVAGLGLFLLSPIFLIVAAAIRFDSPGPVFFRQKRHGFNYQTFSVFKFRTMYHGDGRSSVKQATRNDPRVTRVGAVLRKTSLDELPQIFNVLRGEMAVVGPRPHAIEHNDHFAQRIRSYLARHRVRPGITGWAQVNGFRGETETIEKMRGRVEHDLYYVDNWSLTFDLQIILATFGCLVHPNAY